MKASTIINGKGSDNKELQDYISRLPLDCLMTVMKLVSPKDVCRSAAVCTVFQSVANSDYVWESFLPADLSSILSRAEIDVQQLPVSKKELYLHLCRNWILLDGGAKSLRLDLLDGAKIIFLQKQYPFTEIHCKDLSPKRDYAAYIVFTGTHDSLFLSSTQWVHDSSRGVNSFYSMEIWCKKSQIREDGWREIKFGEFNTGVSQNQVVHFIIFGYYNISMENDPNFVGIEVNPKLIGDGDDMIIHVDASDPRSPFIMPREIYNMVIARMQARAAKDFIKADTLQDAIIRASYRIIMSSLNEEILTKEFSVRLNNNKELQDYISQLPLECLTTVMQLTSPKDVCRSAVVCTTFQSMANLDYVWESFLPADLDSFSCRD